MSEANKSEKAGAKTPVDPSKVEGTQNAVVTNDFAAENAGLKSELLKNAELLEARNGDIQTLNDEKTVLKTENDSLKAKVADLEKQLKDSKASSSKKGKAAKRFVVTNSFRSNVKGEEGKIYNIDDDVTDFDGDRLKDLVARDLVKEV